uniref:Conserved hypothetical plastid protein n=1 Tax=Bangiopsis subsimplex TaxID=139980 RepID=A0A1C9CCP1_9RHOD|nr:hypothetical protein Bangp_076 [Bangiopsis subsimplex]AOM66158.1 hypothetical protein Bangp_076 [Bangiopsis subsimplex]ARO90482.1 conserved hypothetical plastid protein [Bangiopsis subsimplex]
MLIADDLDKLLDILPDFIRNPLELHSSRKELIEVVIDLGRRPEARFPYKPEYLALKNLSWSDLDYCIKRIGSFSGDNRAGIEKTLHRISCIKNRQGNIVGLTCRVGRAIFGTISIIRDLLERQESILILGKPGVGKTTAIREIARILADEMQKRVVIIDTSNEIAGDGDIPHPSIGRARRMQVARPELQHQVMIEAVENHMPEVIIIDEIGTELEAAAAKTIAERGVQLVGTAHGNCLNSLIKNPTLVELVGGIQQVTLGDDEAKRRGSQKSILERKASSAFQIAIEIHDKNNWIIHEKVDVTIDQLLQGFQIFEQNRRVEASSKNIIDCVLSSQSQTKQSINANLQWRNVSAPTSINKKMRVAEFTNNTVIENNSKNLKITNFPTLERVIWIYTYLIDPNECKEWIDSFRWPIIVTHKIEKADIILGLRSQIKQNTKLRKIARMRKMRIYTISNHSKFQIIRALQRILNIYVVKN